MAPKTQYAKKGEVSIAFQVVGDGPIDLVLVNGLVAHMDLLWTEPAAAAMLNRLASFSRLILFDKPGTGLSDPVAGAPTVEQRMGDVEAVMDAAGSERAALIGYSEGGAPAALFAATFPERTTALILLSTAAKWYPAPDYFQDLPAFRKAWRNIDELAYKRWGEGAFALWLSPNWARSELHARTAGIAERASASPGMVRAIIDAVRDYDLRAALPMISAPTLVLHARDEVFPIEVGRDLAERIAGARFVELPSDDHLPFAAPDGGDADDVARSRPSSPASTVRRNRIAFSRPCSSPTSSARRSRPLRSATRAGASCWTHHDRRSRGELERFRGREIKTPRRRLPGCVRRARPGRSGPRGAIVGRAAASCGH